jgi:hypothetical protein
MTALTDRTPKDTYKDLLQVSNSNSGIDGTRRNISDGEATNAPIKVSTSAAEFTGIVDLSAATLGIAADAILFSNIDWSGTDTLTGEIDVASGASIDFLSGSTLTLATGSTFTVPADFIPLSKIDLSSDDTIGGALTVASGSSITFVSGSTFAMTTGSTLSLLDNQIPLAKVDLSDDDTISGALAVASGASLTFASGASLVLNQDAVFTALQVAHFQEQQSAGTDGGGLTASAWRTRALNTTVTNNVSGASLGSSQVTLPKGRYRVNGFAAANRVNGHKSRLYNTTSSAALLIGSSSQSNSAVSGNTTSTLAGEFTLATASTLELQHRPEATRGTDGRGLASNVSASEIYSEVLFTRMGA